MEPVKILLISAFFPPEVGSAAHLYYELGQAFKARGHEVTVLTGLPRYHVVGKLRRLRRRPLIWETYHGLRVLRVFNLDVPWDSPVLRGIDQFISAFFTGMAGTFLPRFDVALVYSPPLPLALAALALCRLRGRPLVVNIQDLFPQSAIDLGILRNAYIIRVFRGLESFLYRQADLITVHSQGNRGYVLGAGGEKAKVRVIPNWVDTEAIKPGSRETRLREEIGLNQHFIVSFAGIMGYSQDLETVLRSAALLKDHPDIVFLLVGDGVEKPKLMETARKHHLTNVHFLPMRSKEEYPEVLAASDVCLATLRKEVRTPVVPSKILSIMAAGRTVVASLPLDGDAPRLINEARCGVCLPPEDPEAMARAVLHLYRHRELLGQMEARGRDYAVEYHSLARCVDRLEASLGQVLDR
jgi:colanic acid biosynthesis glycosyl transferase WcaI